MNGIETTKKTWLANTALQYARAGVQTVPLKLDGSKGPALLSWKHLQSVPSSDQELCQYFNQEVGIGIVCGAISGGLEVMDFDTDAETVFPTFNRLVEHLVVRLPIVETPSGGYHLYYRCNEVGGNTKIASDPTQAKSTLIETRGEGGYVVGPASPSKVHRLNYPYVPVAGPFIPEQIPTITVAERAELWAAARTFDKSGEFEKLKSQAVKQRQRQTGNLSHINWKSDPVVDRFIAQTDIESVLIGDGWIHVHGCYWRHGASNHRYSATLRENQQGNQVLVCYSENAPCGKGTFNAFDYLKKTRYQDDYKATRHAIKQEVAV